MIGNSYLHVPTRTYSRAHVHEIPMRMICESTRPCGCMCINFFKKLIKNVQKIHKNTQKKYLWTQKLMISESNQLDLSLWTKDSKS